MKKIGFIGGFDKIALLLQIAKVLTSLDKKVLIMDTTITQKAKYIVPTIEPSKSYITEFEKIDVGVGFYSEEDVQYYLQETGASITEYDFILWDIDSIKNFKACNIFQCEKNYFVTSFDLYSLKKGLEIVSKLAEPITLTKIMFSKNMLKEEEDYLDFLALETKVSWTEDYKMYFPLDDTNQNAIMESQRLSKVGIRKLTAQYKEALQYTVIDLLDGVPAVEVKKAFRVIEKEV